MPAGGQHLGVEAAKRADGTVVDVDDPAGHAVEMVVRRLVLSHEGLGRQEAVAPRRAGAQRAAAASGIFSTTRVSCTAGE
jgi:hypothetical protein